MADFLTRLVTATYQPGAALRPRPVAHFESIGVPQQEWEDEDARQAPAHNATPLRHEPDAPARTQQLLAPQPSSRTAHPAPPAVHETAVKAPPPPEALPAASLTAQMQSTIQPEHVTAPPARPAMQAENTELPRRQPAPAPVLGEQQSLVKILRYETNNSDETRRKPPVTLAEAAEQVAKRVPVTPASEPGAQKTSAGAAAPAQPPPLAAQRTIEATPAAPVPQIDGATTKRPAAEEPRAAATLNTRRTAGVAAVKPVSTPPAATPAPAPAAPVIHVTIGRIVLKPDSAAGSKAARARPAPAKPALSLDDYLTTRRGGEA